MTSDKKVAANRANARQFTGPKTARGKAAARLNALAHGLRAEASVVLPGEPADAREAHRAGTVAALARYRGHPPLPAPSVVSGGTCR